MKYFLFFFNKMVEYQPADNSQPEDNEAGEGFGAQVL